jgi:hypothetical protein
MLPYIGCEFVELLRSMRADTPATDRSSADLQGKAACKNRERLTPVPQVTRAAILSRCWAVAKKLILCIFFLVL